MDQLKDDRIRDTTKKIYFKIWRYFNEFFIKLDVKPETWEQRLTLFVRFLIKRRWKSTTIKSYISAFKVILYNIGVELNPDQYLLASLTCACRIKHDRIHVKVPICRKLLNWILDRCTTYFKRQQQIYLGKLYRAILASAYYGMLRIGEITAGDHPIKAVDVKIATNKKKLLFILRTLKTHNKGNNPQIV